MLWVARCINVVVVVVVWAIMTHLLFSFPLDPLCGGKSEEQSDLMCQLQAEEEELGGEKGQKAH